MFNRKKREKRKGRGGKKQIPMSYTAGETVPLIPSLKGPQGTLEPKAEMSVSTNLLPATLGKQKDLKKASGYERG
jgi:hypothetical protein